RSRRRGRVAPAQFGKNGAMPSTPYPRRVRRSLLVLTVVVVAAPIVHGAGRAGARVAAPSLRPRGAPLVGPYRVLAGSLHDHSTDSDGDTASADVAAWESAHHAELGVDFTTLTDHSDGFPLALGDPTSPDPWRRQAALTQQYSHDGFSLLRGFEWTND